jgi:TetR/AcrR family transcriptional repressor of bet genes
MPATAPIASQRTASREKRRRQLITATIKCISQRGLGSTTMAEVAKEAGLSQGIVNLHFQSKENLLNQTLQYLADEYEELFKKALAVSGPGAAEKLLALMQHDLKPSICDRKKLAVWFAFWGEVKAVPNYQKICAEYDQGYDDVITELCEEIIAEGNYREISAKEVCDALSSMTDGLWLSCLINPKTWDRAAALAAVRTYLRAVFPGHYQNI